MREDGTMTVVMEKQTIMRRYQQRVKRILPGGVHYNFYTPWTEAPLHFSKTENSRLWDMNGCEYLDLYARFGAMIIGHANEEYNNVLKDTIDRVLSVSHSDIDAEAIELLSRYIPSAEMVRFGLSGTEIVQNALRLARAWTGKNQFVRFEGHYHGNADNIMGGKSLEQNGFIPHEFFGDLQGTQGRAKGILEEQSYLVPWNNISVLEQLLINKGDNIAAIITEPICINGGGIFPAKGYLEKVRALCDKYHIALIFDEIITGVRVGLGGAQKALNVIPDLTTLGKAIGGGGVPVAALAGKKEIMSLLAQKKVVHAGTFNGYPLGMAAIKATFDILARDNQMAIERMLLKSKQIHDLLVAKCKELEFPLVVQGPPGCAAYHCTDTPLTSPSDYTYEIMSKDTMFNSILANNGILVSTFSRLYPNISLSSGDIEWFEQRIGSAVTEARQSLLDDI